MAFNSALSEIPGCVWSLKKTKGDIPIARRGHGAAVYNNNLFVYGGQALNPADDTNIILMLNLGIY